MQKRKYIGKCYMRDAECGNIAVYKITGITTNYFLVTHYYIGIGFSVKEDNLQMRFSMTNANNFHEIPERLFRLMEAIHNMSGKYEYVNIIP